MDTYEELLEQWCRSASVMHLAHHTAAARYARIQIWLGMITAGLGAIVASSVFVAASKGPNPVLLLITGFLSILAAVISASSASLDAGGKSKLHYTAAAAFQGLRREIEEDLVRCRNGTPKESYEHLRNRWTAALANAIPLPPKIHDSVRNNVIQNPFELSSPVTKRTT